jgi:hypothetical protein
MRALVSSSRMGRPELFAMSTAPRRGR